MRVKEIMTQDVKTCGAEDRLSTAARIMWDNDCGIVPIVADDGRERIPTIFYLGDGLVQDLGSPAEHAVLIDGLGIFVGAGRLDRGEGDAIAVDEELDIVRAFEALDLLVAVALEADLDLIVAVAGKQIRD